MNSIEESMQKNIVDLLDENNRLLVLLTEMSSISHNLMAKKPCLKMVVIIGKIFYRKLKI